MSRRNERVSVAIISEGDTEAWYFNQLSRAERVYISTFPKEGRKLTSMLKKAEDLICDNSYDFIFCMVDMDTITSFPKRTKLNKLINLAEKENKLYIIRSQPCFEYWFYLHRNKYSSRFFETWSNNYPLKPEVKKIITNYEKSNKFYQSINGRGIYSFLRPKLINAGKNSLKLFNENNTRTVCEIFYVVGFIFCSKCREQDCSDEKFFDGCIKSKHLCVNLEKELKK